MKIFLRVGVLGRVNFLNIFNYKKEICNIKIYVEKWERMVKGESVVGGIFNGFIYKMCFSRECLLFELYIGFVLSKW